MKSAIEYLCQSESVVLFRLIYYNAYKFFENYCFIIYGQAVRGLSIEVLDIKGAYEKK